MRRIPVSAVVAMTIGVALAGCGATGSRQVATQISAKVAPTAVIKAVGAESQYANVISQIGGRYVHVTGIMTNPNTDPHTYDASPSVAKAISTANLVVQNGLGYDSFMSRLEAAAPSSARRVINVQQLLRLPDTTPNPHLWYSPATMPAVARALVKDLSAIQSSHAAYFRANETRFLASLRPWDKALAAFKKAHGGATVAVTEPVGDYMLEAAGTDDLTPFKLQADIMNGVDPAPQLVSLQSSLLAGHKVKVFLYNQQVTDSITASFLSAAKRAGIPVVGVYETMPSGYDYQSWMEAEVAALQRAVVHHQSTQKL